MPYGGTGQLRGHLTWLVACAVVLSLGQQIDKSKKVDDVENRMIRYTVDGATFKAGVMLDAGWRWVYKDGKTCESTDKTVMESCFLQGLDDAAYSRGYGVEVGSPGRNDVTLRYAALGKYATKPNYGSRVYLTDMNAKGGAGYYLFKPLGGEIAFTVDLSRVPAGMNAAVYLVSMDSYGNLGTKYEDGGHNGAGWRRGVGYCDAQCPQDLRYVQDAGWNAGNLMSCCPEMDLLEANRFASAFTAHPCVSDRQGVHACPPGAADCGASSLCDTGGADMNTFRKYGPSQALFRLIDPHYPFTVRTRFYTDVSGSLDRIEQVFEQSGESVSVNITDDTIAEQKALFEEDNSLAQVGGLAQMGRALEKGMVMTLALWSDAAMDMTWLDSCLSNVTKSHYNCSDHFLFDSPKVFEEAPPGVWRGPVDAYTDLATSFASRGVDLSYPGLPSDWKTQPPFECSKSASGEWDCCGVEYQFVVGDFALSKSLPPEPHLGPLPERATLPHAGRGRRWFKLGCFIIILAVMGSVCAFCALRSNKLCDSSSSDENEWPFRSSRKKSRRTFSRTANESDSSE